MGKVIKGGGPVILTCLFVIIGISYTSHAESKRKFETTIINGT